MPSVVNVSVDDEAIAKLFVPGLNGDGWHWMRRVGNQHKDFAIAAAPQRTGFLATQHKVSLQPNGKYQCRYSVANYAPYARYVHEGTTGPIHSNRTTMAEINADYAAGLSSVTPHMVVRPSPHSWFNGPVPLLWVEGQSAQPWIVDAAEIIFSIYG
jgi:hypothetical protein